ncbi:hypothetical protein BH24ACI4_BH24ACI4_27480 [soil metagenome]
MKLTGTYRIPGVRERVFSALTDPAILCRCIDGCEELTRVGEQTYEARIRLGIGVLKGVYTGRAELRDLRPPETLALRIDGKGAGGFVSGEATMRLLEVEGETDVVCEGQGQVGGVIAAVGSRLMEPAAKQLLNRFFRALAGEVGAAPR